MEMRGRERRVKVKYSSIRVPETWIRLMDRFIVEKKFSSRVEIVSKAAERLIKEYGLKPGNPVKPAVRREKMVKIPAELLETLRNACEAGDLPFLSAEMALISELRRMLKKA
ncbi:MAG: hypothetical protein QW334_00370 [Thermofilum sp.]